MSKIESTQDLSKLLMSDLQSEAGKESFKAHLCNSQNWVSLISDDLKTVKPNSPNSMNDLAKEMISSLNKKNF
jgi:hypothetical protein